MMRVVTPSILLGSLSGLSKGLLLWTGSSNPARVRRLFVFVNRRVRTMPPASRRETVPIMGQLSLSNFPPRGTYPLLPAQ